MNRRNEFVETLEYRRFAEFCDACRRYLYIGLCYGPPGVGKTLSARRYSDWDRVSKLDPQHKRARLKVGNLRTLFYTPDVVNGPGKIERDIVRFRHRLTDLARQPNRFEMTRALSKVNQRDEKYERKAFLDHDWLTPSLPPLKPTFSQVVKKYVDKEKKVADPTTLLMVDEADRLRMASLEQMRFIFDSGGIGLILIGMPGIEKRIARYPQFYSRIGFVHEFRPLGMGEVRDLLMQRWTPPGVCLPHNKPIDPEVIAVIIRVTGGNFRLLNRLLTQIERVLEINRLEEVTKDAVQAARESLVIGTM
jgi:DNA transposition AAA+ family ATPase